jgi:DNA-binding MarR family transcriptional regulator
VANGNLVNDSRTDAIVVANALRPVLLKLARELRREAHALGVSGGQVSLLIQIHKNPGLGVRELAAREGVSAAAMSRAVERLERAGLVSRTPDPADRRRHGLAVTDEGVRVLRSVKRKRTTWLAQRLEGLDDDERRALADAIEPLSRLLGDRA